VAEAGRAHEARAGPRLGVALAVGDRDFAIVGVVDDQGRAFEARGGGGAVEIGEALAQVPLHAVDDAMLDVVTERQRLEDGLREAAGVRGRGDQHEAGRHERASV
jgi:hypothetical protein